MNQSYPYYYYQPYQQQGYPYFYYPTASPAQYPTSSRNQAMQQPSQTNQQQMDIEGMLPMEQSYIENILRLNRGKHVVIYMTIERETKTFEGVIEAAGRDHIIISDPETGRRYLLLMVYLDYVVFNEKINYDYPLGNFQNQMATYPQR